MKFYKGFKSGNSVFYIRIKLLVVCNLDKKLLFLGFKDVVFLVM